jgi:hypothetical protein
MKIVKKLVKLYASITANRGNYKMPRDESRVSVNKRAQNIAAIFLDRHNPIIDE